MSLDGLGSKLPEEMSAAHLNEAANVSGSEALDKKALGEGTLSLMELALADDGNEVTQASSSKIKDNFESMEEQGISHTVHPEGISEGRLDGNTVLSVSTSGGDVHVATRGEVAEAKSKIAANPMSWLKM
jgi:hypothetical protein